MNKLVLLPTFILFLFTASHCLAQDVSPLKNYHVWLPMTGVNDQQMMDARAAGYDTIMLKIHPAVRGEDLKEINFAAMDKQVDQAASKGFKLLLPILGWVGLGDGKFWDTEENGDKIKNQLDPFWPEAMDQVEWYYGKVIEHYKKNPKVVAFAPTWGIYGEAGFTSQSGGRSTYALERFNEWRLRRGLPKLDKLPDKKRGPNTDYNLFIWFRYLYIEQQFDAMITRLKKTAGTLPVGMWQELYPVIGYLWNMVEVPSADFALYESCFPFQTNHHPEKSLCETMGFRYRCKSPEDYRNYYLPLLARKRGEGQRFMGCQLTNDYAVNYGWTIEEAEKAQFDRFEDEFGPHLKKLLDEPLESPKRDVLLVFPTYTAAALNDDPINGCDTMLIDILLRMYGCQMERYASPRLDKMSIADMDRFKLIIVPESDFILQETYEKLRNSKATVVFSGSFGQSFNGGYIAPGVSRIIDNMDIRYADRPAGAVSAASAHRLTRGLTDMLRQQPVKLPKDDAFTYGQMKQGTEILLRSGSEPLLSARDGGRQIFIHGHLFASLCYNPDRKVPDLIGSKDPSANEVDMWGPYDASHPQNAFGYAVMKNILDFAGVDYRVPNPKPRTFAPFLGDHVEQASVSANIAYNNTAEPQTITVRLPYAPEGYQSKMINGRYEADVTVPAFSYVVLKAGTRG